MELIKSQDNPNWVEKWRPTKIADAILPKDVKKSLQSYIKAGFSQNLILHGGPGNGKTTAAMALCDELEAEYYMVNASLKGNIDTLRTEIQDFASSMSILGGSGRKYVILDEADNLTAATQTALRAFMEEFSKKTGFIMTCNYLNRLIEPLQSRTVVIDVTPPKDEQDELQYSFFRRIQDILFAEEVTYDEQTLAVIIQKYYPDYRRTLNQLQNYAIRNGEIDSGILDKISVANIDELVAFMKAKNYTSLRQWVGENSDISHTAIFRQFYDTAIQFVTPQTLPLLVILLGKYQYQASFVADQEINLAAFLTEALLEVEFK